MHKLYYFKKTRYVHQYIFKDKKYVSDGIISINLLSRILENIKDCDTIDCDTIDCDTIDDEEFLIKITYIYSGYIRFMIISNKFLDVYGNSLNLTNKSDELFYLLPNHVDYNNYYVGKRLCYEYLESKRKSEILLFKR